MNKIAARFASVIIGVFLFMSSAIPAGAIQNGEFDFNEHPYVCLVVFYDQAGRPLWRTTGSLLSPTVVLTAGHGTSGTSTAKVWFLNRITAGSGYPYGGGINSYAGMPRTIEGYSSQNSGGLPRFDYHDVGLVILNSPVPARVVSQYAALPAEGLIDTLPMMSAVDLVGYGVTSQEKGKGIAPADSWLWDRQRNSAPANLVTSNGVLSSEFLKITANPAKNRGGATFGDSGGPVLFAGTNVILGINSFVNNPNCDGVTYAQRLDLPDILDWIHEFLDPSG
ncbi:trypsin-like serine protease [Dehalogenimonas alkenigignens]|uniref:trypsin-like serine protease n=1 Tax=Dehalogenimonas alkenigignens TaxID=1217799 RepID=UPI000D56CD00|nr:trypsin-like serine protease [Dehalogenimonas alkenigignens]PVV82762.1 hypothetical protein DD509_08215 [Dehalogenimonas alkenigignens]